MLRNARLALLLLALAACARSGAQWGTPGEVRIGYLGTIYTLDPLIAFGQRLIDLTQLYTQPLVGISPQTNRFRSCAKPIPTFANGGISRDGLTITYHLRPVRFADGVPFTSRDVAFTYRAILDARNPVTEADPYRRIAALETPDAHTVRIRLRHPWSAAPYELFAASDYIFGILPGPRVSRRYGSRARDRVERTALWHGTISRRRSGIAAIPSSWCQSVRVAKTAASPHRREDDRRRKYGIYRPAFAFHRFYGRYLRSSCDKRAASRASGSWVCGAMRSTSSKCKRSVFPIASCAGPLPSRSTARRSREPFIMAIARLRPPK